ncbi:MAG: MerR family transcriptional regulator [Myxococcales bacterium]|nr:MerR family transcriptional regulator [Myxococcales bacterium]
MRIGQAAAEAGVNVQTLRYYERRGLLREPERQPSGYRAYTDEMVRVVRFIKRAQELGFTLNDVAELLRLTVDGARCQDVQTIAANKLRELEQKIEALTAMKGALVQLLGQCRRRKRRVSCPLLDTLGKAEQRDAN